jgi:GT2 family glycosyltransferase
MIPFVSIIILSFNGARYLEACIQSLLEMDYPNFKITVVDNNSKDHSASLLREKFPSVELIENAANYGFAEGMNIGIRQALERRADYVFLVNQDTRFDRDCLRELLAVAGSSSGIGLLVPMQFEYGGHSLNSVFKSWLTCNLGPTAPDLAQLQTQPFYNVQDVSGAAMLISRKALETVGLCDPIYFAYSEESDLCRRLHLHGFRLVLCTRARFWHKTGMSPWKDRLLDRSRLIFALKNPYKGFPYNFSTMLMIFFRFLKRGLAEQDYPYVIFMAWSLYDIIKHLSSIYFQVQAEKKGFGHIKAIPQRPYDTAPIVRMLFGKN